MSTHGATNAAVAGIALAVFLATIASASLTAGAGPVPILWLANGVAIAAMLLGGAAIWPGIALGAGVGAATILSLTDTVGSGLAAPLTLIFTAAITIESRLCHRLLVRRAGGTAFSATPTNAFRFVYLVLGCAIVGSIGVGLCLVLIGDHGLSTAIQLATCWWLASAAGTLIVVPMAIAATRRHESSTSATVPVPEGAV